MVKQNNKTKTKTSKQPKKKQRNKPKSPKKSLGRDEQTAKKQTNK
jgi:hypothetical protein